MSETNPPVKVLNFLQTEVSSVVNHGDPNESAIFRNLLGHLLTPPSSSSSATSSEHRKADNRKSSDSPGHSNASDDEWTNTLDEDELMAATTSSTTPPFTGPHPILSPLNKYTLSAAALCSVPDALEFNGDVGGGGEDLSGERYRQRTEIFDSLLLFVGDQWKSPSGNLVDMIDG